KHWPESRHNRVPSQAVDVYPYPCTHEMMSDSNHPVWKEMSDMILGIADEQGVNITWGGNWNFKDCPHYQIEP
ncbi:MAG: M15 family metallopeptidase, partial [bacterium]